MAVLREDVLGAARGTTLSAQLNAGATSLSVATGGLATWTPVVHNRIPVVINEGFADEERLYATNVSGDSLTGLIRGQDGTTDQTHVAGATVTVGLFADHVDQANAFLSLPTAKGDLAVASAADTWARQAAGADNTVLVYDAAQPNGVKATATLAGITLTAPVIDDLSGAQHTHADADDGGALASPSITGTVTGGATYTAPTINDGTVNLDGGTLILPQATVPAQTAEGSVVWDTDNELLTVGTGAAQRTMVDTTSTQTLGNKTLGSPTLLTPNITTPTINDFINAQHDHGDTNSGGAVLLAALPASIPRGRMGYATVSADATGTSATIATVTNVPFIEGRLVRISGYCRALSSSVGTDTGAVFINVGGTQVQSAGVSFTAANVGRAVYIEYVGEVIGTATVTLTFARGTGTGTWTWNAEADAPSTLLIEDIGEA